MKLKPDISREKDKDAGLALVLILLLGALFWDYLPLTAAAAAVVLLCMTVPRIFAPWSLVWYGLSHILGLVMSKIILTIIYLTLLVPVGWCRRLIGADPLKLKLWKKGTASVFDDRDHTFGKEDIEHPY